MVRSAASLKNKERKNTIKKICSYVYSIFCCWDIFLEIVLLTVWLTVLKAGRKDLAKFFSIGAYWIFSLSAFNMLWTCNTLTVGKGSTLSVLKSMLELFNGFFFFELLLSWWDMVMHCSAQAVSASWKQKHEEIKRLNSISVGLIFIKLFQIP